MTEQNLDGHKILEAKMIILSLQNEAKCFLFMMMSLLL